ncbi:hypothetical protein K469DRAFT_716043 [Zopfia rhizophila CBS 207.26]|uniref:Uncharacterized protein n=1 Tax=Zopfia rhizophila CBS 207.26 TaxID=1314779 RepID=A0A6A6DL42_9PEZI|nr:hypothetical protein K469DRAFT_716043 [Zopfia rhizophila CBS 207.26]
MPLTYTNIDYGCSKCEDKDPSFLDCSAAINWDCVCNSPNPIACCDIWYDHHNTDWLSFKSWVSTSCPNHPRMSFASLPSCAGL